MTCTASYLYKYRSVNKNLIDIIAHNRLYMATASSMNDTFEGNAITFYRDLSAPIENLELLKAYISAERDRYRILSLASSPFSAAMWAHYASDSRGVCLVLNRFGPLDRAVPMRYADEPLRIPYEWTLGRDWAEVQDVIRQSYLSKTSDWRYEQEQRILTTSEDPYLNLDCGTICAILFGLNIPDSDAEMLSFVGGQYGIPCFYSHRFRDANSIEFFSISMGRHFSDSPFFMRDDLWNGNKPAYLCPPLPSLK